MKKETFEALMSRQLEIYDTAVQKAKREAKKIGDGGLRDRMSEELLESAEHLGRAGLIGISMSGHKVFEAGEGGRKGMIEKLCEFRGIFKGKRREDSLLTKMVYRLLGIEEMPAFKALKKTGEDVGTFLEKAEPVFKKVDQYGRMLEKYSEGRGIGIKEAVGNPTAELYAALNTFETEEEHEKFLKDYEDVLKHGAMEVILHNGSEVALRFDKDHFYFFLSLAKANSLEDLNMSSVAELANVVAGRRADELNSVYQEVLNAFKGQGGPVEEFVSKTVDYAMGEHRHLLQLRREFPKESKIKLKEMYKE